MKLLHIDSSILGPNSVSRQLTASIVKQLTEGRSDVEVTYRDLAADPVPHLSGAYLAGAATGGEGMPAPVQEDIALGRTVLGEFLAADTIVIGLGLYNFTVPSQLKAWVDRILVAGQTFRYTAEGRPEGLVGDKRVVLGIARGGFYGEGSPTAQFEHAETYMRAVLGFIGIYAPQVVAAEGVAVGPEQRAAALSQAEGAIAGLAA